MEQESKEEINEPVPQIAINMEDSISSNDESEQLIVTPQTRDNV